MRTGPRVGMGLGVALLTGAAAWVASRGPSPSLEAPPIVEAGGAGGPDAVAAPGTANPGGHAAGPAEREWPSAVPVDPVPSADSAASAGGAAPAETELEFYRRGIGEAVRFLRDAASPVEKKLFVAVGFGKLISRAAMLEGGADVVAEAAQVLVDVVKFDPDEDVKWAALGALGERIPFEDPTVSSLLSRALSTDSGKPGDERRAQAAMRLVLEHDPAAPDALLTIVKDCPFPSVRAEAASRLAHVSVSCPPALPEELFDLFAYAETGRGAPKELSPAEREEIERRRRLRQRHDAGRLEQAVEAARTAPDVGTRRSLYVVLTSLSPERAVPVFEAAAAHEADPGLRRDLEGVLAAVRAGRTNRREDLLPLLQLRPAR